MSVTDPIADALTKIRNAQMVGHETVVLRFSSMMEAILKILKEEGFIESTKIESDGAKKSIHVDLRYYQGQPVIRGIEKISKPGRRVYQKWQNIRPTLNNLGLSIYSSPKGIVSGKTAKYMRVGGEYICKVW